MKRLLMMLAVLAAAAYVGCKQQDGDRCQVNEDCETGVCNMSKGTCSASGSGSDVADAEVPDGPPIDAFVGDAPNDAPADMQ